MLLDHHTIPLATGDIVVVGSTEQGIATEALCHTVSPHVGIGRTDARKVVVHGLRIVHVVEVRHRLNREKHQLLIEVAGLSRDVLIQAQGTQLQTLVVVSDLSPLARFHIIGLCIQHFRCDTGHILAVAVVDVSGFLGDGILSGKTAEHRTEEAAGVVDDILLGIFLRIPGHVHEELDGILHRLQVADIKNPHALDAEVIGQRQLFEHLLRLCDVEPLRITGSTDIVHMVVDAPPAFVATLLVSDGNTTDVAPVVVTHQHDDIVGNTESGIIIVLYLFI